MIRNIILSAIAGLKRKKTASLFTILTISLGMTMVVLLTSLYHSYTGNIGPYANRDKCLYLSNLSFEKDGITKNRLNGNNATSSFINETTSNLKESAIVGLYGLSSKQDFGATYKPFRIKYIETDANFWKIHKFTFLDGKPYSEDEVNNKEQVTVISRKVAMQFLGDTKVAGKYLDDGHDRKYRITGVIEDVNPHFEVGADIYLPYTISVWNEDIFTTWEDSTKVFYNRGHYKV